MSNKIRIELVLISAIAILIDCYAARALFLMLAMAIGHYISPILVLLLALAVPAIFIWSVVNLFKFKRWAFITFFIMTILFHSFLIYIYLYIFSIAERRLLLGSPQIFLILFFLTFSIFFLSPPVRRLFK